MPKWLSIPLRVIGTLLFVSPLAYILIKYGITKTEEVTLIQTSGGLNMFWTLVIGVISLGIVLYIVVGLLTMWKEKIKSSPFGSVSQLTFGLMITLFLLITVLGLNYMLSFIEENTQGFIDVLNAYASDFRWMLGFEVIGVLVNTSLAIFK